MSKQTGPRPVPPQDYYSSEEVMRMLRISKQRLYAYAAREVDPLPLRTFPGVKRGAIADRDELREWVMRNTVLVRERRG